MKILKDGEQKKPWTKEVDCKNCKAKLLLEEGDLYYTRSFDKIGDGELFTSYTCVYCDNENDIKLGNKEKTKIFYDKNTWNESIRAMER